MSDAAGSARSADAAVHAQLVAALLAWGREHLRDLPWRRTRDPWLVLVSETMLQQTQVDRVLPRFVAFVDRFATPVQCAAAPVGELVRAWDGLGYNRRATLLHAAAVQITERHDGQVPDTLEALLALPGVGPYTARAVLAFAFEADHGVVDTNAARFLARAVAGRRLASAEAQAIADGLVPSGQAWEWNQSVLDLGATICTKRHPSCGTCPLASWCAWTRAGRPEPDPAHGSAGVSTPQARFEGSDRQGRGRLVAALRRGPIARVDLARAAGWPGDPQRAERVAEGLVADGLAVYTAGDLALPGS